MKSCPPLTPARARARAVGENAPGPRRQVPPGEAWPGENPKLAARRRAVTRQAERRSLRRACAALLGLALGATGWWLLDSPLLDVDAVVVSGAMRGPISWMPCNSS